MLAHVRFFLVSSVVALFFRKITCAPQEISREMRRVVDEEKRRGVGFGRGSRGGGA